MTRMRPLIAGPDGKVQAGAVVRVEGTGELREVVWAMSAGDWLEARTAREALTATDWAARHSSLGLIGVQGPATKHALLDMERQRRKWIKLGRRGER